MTRFVLTLLAAALILPLSPGTALAQSPEPVYCGSVTCFQFRVDAGNKTPADRAAQAMNVINKNLGGKTGKVSTKADGKNVRLLLNGELLAVVTPADAAAEKVATPKALADKWGQRLTKAFNESKAVR
jgi:hypothetical protein